MKIVAVIQARMGSTRLPGKVLKDIVGKPMLWHIADRLKHAKLVDQIIVATSDNERDEAIIAFAKDNKIDYYAGSEIDLLDRIYQVAKQFEANAIVRITADCPLVDPVVVDKVVKYYFEKGPFDYVSNSRPEATYPLGLDVEICSFHALTRAWEEVKDHFMRSQALANLYVVPNKYRLGSVRYDRDLSYMRWTVDYQDDLDFVTEIYKRLYQEDKIFLTQDILNLLEKDSKLMEINRGHTRDTNYLKAMEEAYRLKGLM